MDSPAPSIDTPPLRPLTGGYVSKGSAQFQQRTAYGVTRFHPVNETAQLFCAFVGQKTLLLRDLQIIQKLGFSVELVPVPLEDLSHLPVPGRKPKHRARRKDQDAQDLASEEPVVPEAKGEEG